MGGVCFLPHPNRELSLHRACSFARSKRGDAVPFAAGVLSFRLSGDGRLGCVCSTESVPNCLNRSLDSVDLGRGAS